MRLLAVSILCTALASCGSAPSKSGGDVGTATIRAILSGDPPNTPGGDLMEHISSEVGTLSNGAIEVVTDQLAGAESEIDHDGAMIELVREGETDLAVVRAATFSSAGTTRFAALQAPFLIDNQDAAELIANDPIADEMLASLDDLGLVGLAVVPSGLRHPFGWYSPLVGTADYTNATINTRPGREVDMLFDALGATTDHSVGQQRATAATNGELNGIEVSLQLRFSVGPPLIMTANVVLYTKFDIVVVNKRFFEGLTEAQQTVIRDAVAAAIPEALAGRATETAAFEQWCGEIGNVAVLATPSDIDALGQAVAPMIGELERDPFTKRAIERIRQLAAGTKRSSSHRESPVRFVGGSVRVGEWPVERVVGRYRGESILAGLS
jgi:TRAP-type C4-dicarboxylate transport system substrate-binding protein